MSSDLEASPQKNRLRRDWSSGLDATCSDSDDSESDSDDSGSESDDEQDESDSEDSSDSDSDEGGDVSDNDENPEQMGRSNPSLTLSPSKDEKGFPQTIESTAGAGLIHIPRSFFTEEERQILRGHKSAFREHNRSGRTQLVEKLARQLKKNGSKHSNKTIRTKIYRYMGSGQRSLEKLMPWKKPTLKSVVAYEHEEEIKNIILEKYQLVPGDRAFIGKHATVVKALMDEFPETRMEELQLMLAEWRAVGPPKERQRKLAESSLDSLILRFSQRIHMETGARMVVLAGFHGRDGQLRYGVYDFNGLIGSGKPDFSKFFPGCSKTEMTQRFQEYLQEHLTDSEDDTSEKPAMASQCSRKARPTPELSANEWGEPLLPDDFLQIKDLERRKDIIRAWIAGFYNLAAGTKKAKVPWSSVKSNPSNYIDPGCWPSEVEFKEASKLRKEEIEELYNLWTEREKNEAVPAFQFHHVKAPNTRDSTKEAIDWRAAGRAKTKELAKDKEPAKGRNKKAATGKVKGKDNGRTESQGDAGRGNSGSKKRRSQNERSTGHTKRANDISKELSGLDPQDDLSKGGHDIGETALDAILDPPGDIPSQSAGTKAGATNSPLTPAVAPAYPPQPFNLNMPKAGAINSPLTPAVAPAYPSQPFNLNMPNSGTSMDQAAAMSALGFLTQLLTGQGNLQGMVGPSGFQAPIYPGPFPAIDPSLNGILAPPFSGYPTGGPNDSTPPGYYPVPHNLMPPERSSPSGSIAAKEVKEAPISKPKHNKDAKQAGKAKSKKKQSKSTRQKDDGIKAEVDSPTKRLLPNRFSPIKRKFEDFDGHAELTGWEKEGKAPENGTKRRKVIPRPLTMAQKTANREAMAANPDALFVRSTHGKQR